MLTYLLQASTCLIVLYAIYHFILSELTFFKYNRVYLILSIVIALIIPVVAPLLVLPKESLPGFNWSHITDINYVNTESKTSAFDWKAIAAAVLKGVYFTGVLVVYTKMMYGLARIYFYYKKGQKQDYNGYHIVTTDEIHLPFSFFRSIYISKHFPLKGHLQTILDHEAIHIRQWHTLDVLFAEIVHALFWFNPVMIFYKRALRQAHEYMADDLICRNNSAENYMELLLSKSGSGLELALTNQFFQSQLKNRIIMLTKKPSSTLSLWKFSLAIPVVLMVVYAFATPDYFESEQALSVSSEDTIPPPPPPKAPSVSKNISPPPPPPPPKTPKLNQAPVPPAVPSPASIISSANKQNERPLIVLNGVITSESFNLNNINPDDIQSINVLKNENAVLKYGSKGQNGVIEILTVNNSNTNTGKEQDQEIFKLAEEMPRFPGCENLEISERDMCSKNKLMEYIGQNLRYPEEAKKSAIEGTVVLSFVITKTGDINDVKILKDIGYGCATEAERVIKSMQKMKEKWVPGKQKGKNVDVIYTLPVKFKLSE